MTVAHHLAQARFDVQQRGCEPAVSLARVLPVIDLHTAFLDESIDGLETVGRLQRTAQHAVEPDPTHERLMEMYREWWREKGLKPSPERPSSS